MRAGGDASGEVESVAVVCPRPVPMQKDDVLPKLFSSSPLWSSGQTSVYRYRGFRFDSRRYQIY
jgi:hypothetical protein